MSADDTQLATFGIPTLADETFERFRELIYQKTGIHMREGKQILVSNRLRRRLVQLSLSSYEEYYELLTSGRVPQKEIAHFIDAVSTNETYFFREGNHFAALEHTVLPELFRRGRPVKIWSAGCSTGEEVYTLRMVADQAAKACSARGRASTATGRCGSSLRPCLPSISDLRGTAATRSARRRGGGWSFGFITSLPIRPRMRTST